VTYALLLSPFTGHLLFFSLPLYYHFSTLLSCNPRLACPCLVSPSIYLTPCFTPSLRPPLHFTLPVFDFSSLISCIYLLHPRFLISCFLAFTCISSLYTPIDKKASVYLLYPRFLISCFLAFTCISSLYTPINKKAFVYLLYPRFLISCFLAFTCISSLYTPIDKKASVYLFYPRFLISCFLAFTCISSLYTPIDKKASVYLLYPQRSSQLLGLLHFVLPLNFNSHSYRQASRVLSYPFHLNLHFNC